MLAPPEEDLKGGVSLNGSNRGWLGGNPDDPVRAHVGSTEVGQPFPGLQHIVCQVRNLCIDYHILIWHSHSLQRR